MYLVNGIVTVSGQQFWRVENMDKMRVGIEMLQKPTMLLLVEDFPDAEAFVKEINTLPVPTPFGD